MSRKTEKTIITSSEKWLKVSTKNKDLMDAFLEEKDTRCSSKTVEGYRSDLSIFFTYVLENLDNKFFIDIRKLEFSRFFYFCVNELGWTGSARFNRMRSALSSLSEYVERVMDDEYPTYRNIVLKAVQTMPKAIAREKTILSEEQVNSLLGYLSKTDTQKACWLALAAFSGARFSELLRFTVDILDENNTAFGDLFMETLKPIKTKGRGREGKLLYKYILKDKFLPYYKAWLQDREKILKDNNKDHNYLFVKSDGDPATEGVVRGWVKDCEKFLGVPVYPHALRHFIVTEFARKKIPPLLIQSLIGWSSESMVALYTDLSVKDREWEELENLR